MMPFFLGILGPQNLSMVTASITFLPSVIIAVPPHGNFSIQRPRIKHHIDVILFCQMPDELVQSMNIYKKFSLDLKIVKTILVGTEDVSNIIQTDMAVLVT